jgi:hypothetical protein
LWLEKELALKGRKTASSPHLRQDEEVKDRKKLPRIHPIQQILPNHTLRIIRHKYVDMAEIQMLLAGGAKGRDQMRDIGAADHGILVLR